MPSAAESLLALVTASSNGTAAPLGTAVEPSVDEDPERKFQRKDHTLTQKRKWSNALRVAKKDSDASPEKRGEWLRKFVLATWPQCSRDAKEFARKRALCYRLLKDDGPPAKNGKATGYYRTVHALPKGRGCARTGRTSLTKHSARKRRHGGGNARRCPELGFELWTWFVDTIRNLKCRVSTRTLESQARLLLADAKGACDDLVREGTVTADQVPRWPTISQSWVSDWRRRYRVSYKMTTIVYKVARAVLAHRLGVFWRNCMRLQYFHSKMFPGRRLRWRAYDQKPLYFNQAGGKFGTLASMDDREVVVRENCHATRARFTVMTKSVDKDPDETMQQVCARSSNSGDPERLAVLFKAPSGGERILADLTVPEKTLVQFGPKGSYRTDSVLEFLEWDLGEADGDGDCEAVCLDWFAAHLDDDVQDLIRSKGHVPVYIPGGATPWVATLDTHAHADYQNQYLAAEEADNIAQLLRGASLPECTRQVVLDRAASAWTLVSHERISEVAWLHDGITLPMDGSKDHLLRHQCLPFWYELDMPAARQRIAAGIDMGIRTGELTSWDQYPELLEAYDDHAPLVEGEETGRERLGDPDDDDEDDLPSDGDGDCGDGGEGGGSDAVNGGGVPVSPLGPAAAPGGANACGGGGLSASSSCGGGQVVADVAGCDAESGAGSAASPVALSSQGDSQVATVDSEDLDKLLALQKLATELKVGDASLLKVLDTRIREASKNRSATHPAILAGLRRKAEERRAAQDAIRVQSLEQQEKLRLLKVEERKAKLAVEAAKHMEKAEQAKAKVRLEEVQEAKRQVAEDQRVNKLHERVIRMHFAAQLSSRLLRFCLHDASAHRAQLAELQALVTQQALKDVSAKNVVLPVFMAATRF